MQDPDIENMPGKILIESMPGIGEKLELPIHLANVPASRVTHFQLDLLI